MPSSMKEEDIYTTNFQTKYGHYDFFEVHFALTNALATIMFLMNSVLHPYLDNFVIVFINDILVYSKNEKENVEHLVEVLRLLIDHQLYSKLKKCSFLQIKVHYLRHVVSKEVIIVGLEKISIIMEWEAPRNAEEVRSFMGLSSYYRRFIRNFSQISCPITSLQ